MKKKFWFDNSIYEYYQKEKRLNYRLACNKQFAKINHYKYIILLQRTCVFYLSKQVRKDFYFSFKLTIIINCDNHKREKPTQCIHFIQTYLCIVHRLC